jgi:hypothetical protein
LQNPYAVCYDTLEVLIPLFEDEDLNLYSDLVVKNFHFDHVLKKGSVIVASFKCCSGPEDVNKTLTVLKKIDPSFFKHLFIFSPGKQFFFDQSKNSLATISDIALEEIVKKNINETIPSKTSLITIIESLLKDLQELSKDIFKDNLEIIEFVKKLSITDFVLNKQIDLEFKNEKMENDLFNLLLDEPDRIMGRYMSFGYFKEFISSGEMYMGNILCMNDKTEADFFENIIYDKIPKDNYLQHQDHVSFNQSFISSFSTKNKVDDLVMWRLYGNDGRGVCLVFKLNKTKLNDSYIIKKVKYSSSIKLIPELNLLKLFSSYTKRISDGKVGFFFKNSDIWGRFFKPLEFSYEEEIRMLQLSDKKDKEFEWDIINDVVVPKSFVKMTNNGDFPVLLLQVYLGPNFPQAKLNKIQIQHFLANKHFGYPDVLTSNIVVYR